MTAFLQTLAFSTEDRFYITDAVEKSRPKPEAAASA